MVPFDQNQPRHRCTSNCPTVCTVTFDNPVVYITISSNAIGSTASPVLELPPKPQWDGRFPPQARGPRQAVRPALPPPQVPWREYQFRPMGR